MRRVLSFQKLEPDPLDIGIVAAQRAKLYQAGLPVAPGFVLTPRFFKEYIIESGQHEAFFTVVKSATTINEIHDYITNLKFPEYVEDEILKACEALKGKVSVTVSGAFHDAVFEVHALLPNQIIPTIKSAWASIFHESRKTYLNKTTVFPSVIIQKDMNPVKSGSLYTHNPVNQSGSKVVIDVNYPSKSTIAGVKPENIDISINNDMLTIRGKRHVEENILNEDYLFQECYWGAFSRSVILPVEIIPEKIDAFLEDGVLTVNLPKAKPRQVSIKVKEK